ncbi:MAG: hypothetical protein Q4G70_12950 [Pseudomonadota bacterium]|nr:hypothetical protein [Pseudomonadota bacterium]
MIKLLISLFVLLNTIQIGAQPSLSSNTQNNIELRISSPTGQITGMRDLDLKGLNGKTPLEAVRSSAVHLKRGSSLQLRVETIDSNGVANDVTRHPNTKYDVVGLGDALHVKDGLVTAPIGGGTRAVKLEITYELDGKNGYNIIIFTLNP